MDFISNNLAAITLVLAGLCLVVMLILLVTQVSQLRRQIDQLTGGVESGDLETILGEHLETVHAVGRELDELTARMAFIESSARHHFSKVGLIRFNPFPDTGGNQSFALALLDESDDGVVISSLHSRTGTRIYGKSVTGGKADTSLSTEEQEAVEKPAPSDRPGQQPSRASGRREAPGPGCCRQGGPGPASAARPLVAAGSPGGRPARAPSRRPGRISRTRLKRMPCFQWPREPRVRTSPRNCFAPADDSEVNSEKVHRKPGQR